MKQSLLLTLLIIGMFSAVLIYPTNAQTDDKLNIVATTGVVGDIVKQVGGDLIKINVLINNGIDPHDFNPTLEDTEAIQNADFIFFSGVVEEGMEEELEMLEEEGKAMSLFESIPEEFHLEGGENDEHKSLGLLEEDHDHGGEDPHFWHDPILVKFTVDAIAETLSIVDTEFGRQNNETYLSNAENYNELLDDLHDHIIQQITLLSDGQKFLATQHAAFNYWTHRYGFEGISLSGISTQDEPGLSEIDTFANVLKNKNISVVFLEFTIPDEQIQAVVDATLALGHEVSIGGALYSGSLGVGENSSYIGMMTANTNTIVQAILNPPPNTSSVPISMYSMLTTIMLIIGLLKFRRQKGTSY